MFTWQQLLIRQFKRYFLVRRDANRQREAVRFSAPVTSMVGFKIFRQSGLFQKNIYINLICWKIVSTVLIKFSLVYTYVKENRATLCHLWVQSGIKPWKINKNEINETNNMHSSAFLSLLLSVFFFCSRDKVYRKQKQKVLFLIYWLGQIVTWKSYP